MQRVSKDFIRKNITYTWYLYPVAAIVTGLILSFAFAAYHQPTDFERISIFFSAEMKDDSFLDELKAKFDEEELREIHYAYCSPSKQEYYVKLNMYLSDLDLLVMKRETLEDLGDTIGSYFVPINGEMIDRYLPSSSAYFANHEKNYGVYLQGAEDNWLGSYMDFEEGDYYVCLSQSSVNIAETEEGGEHNNAWKMLSYLVKEL